MKTYEKKIEQSIKLIQSVYESAKKPLELAYSGGKDSDVLLHLVKRSMVPYIAIYRNTTIDPPGTITHVLDNGAEIKQPEKTFFELIREKGLPSRFRRWCCDVLKEYKIHDTCLMGVRRDESKARAERYAEPTQCRVYGGKNGHVNAVYPLLDWTNADILRYVQENNIKLHPLYYNEDGGIDVSKRLGCIACPLSSRNRQLRELEEYPRIIKPIINNLQIYLDTHRHTQTGKAYQSASDYFFRAYFFDRNSDYSAFTNKSNGKFDTRKFLCEYFDVAL